MTAPFDGPDLLVGEIAAIRTFDLRSDGTLWPVFAADRPWADGENRAGCARHEVAGARGCKCGFWAYGSVAALRDQAAARNVAGVIACWGRVTPGTRGLRTQFARLDAIWLSRRVKDDLAAQVAAQYPKATVYRDRAAMLAAHPLTVLPSYRLPDRRPVRLVAARALLQALLAVVVVMGLLPRAAFDTGWVSQVHTQLVQMLAYAGIIAIVRFVVDRRVLAPRTQYGRVLLVAASLMGWVWAPFVGWMWQIELRAPVAAALAFVVLNRTVRFVPTRAGPPPGPSGTPPTGAAAPT